MKERQPGAIETYRGCVYPWEIDHVGHMNVQFYVKRFDEATWHLLSHVGLTTSYMRSERRGMVAREQHIRYHEEVLAGARLVVESRMLEVREKSVRFVHELYDSETGRLSATSELVGVHIDAESRRPCAMPADARARAELLVVRATV